MSTFKERWKREDLITLAKQLLWGSVFTFILFGLPCLDGQCTLTIF
jgi:hypothetical protein